MTEYCLNCGRMMDEGELRCGPGATGCMFCVLHCPRCGREIFAQDNIFDENGEYCIYCRDEVEEEAKLWQEDEDEEDDDWDLDDDYDDEDDEEYDDYDDYDD